MTLGNWLIERIGRDPFADLRGHYATRRGWMRLAAKAGGLAGLVAPRLDRIGLQRTDEPHQAGDVGLVRTPIGVTCAIRTARGYAVKAGDGLTCAAFAPVAVWRVA